MPPALIPLAASVVGAGASKLFGGGQQSQQELDPQSQQYVEMMRQYAGGANQQLTGFDPETGEFGDPSMGPITEQFDMESIMRFLSPFLEEQEGQVNADFDFSRARDIRGAKQEATLAGTGRGSRGAVLEAMAGSESDRNRARALTDIRVGGFGQAGMMALGAQPFRNMFAREPLSRLEAGQGLLTGGYGQAGATTTGPGADPWATAISAGTIAAGAFGKDPNEIPFGVGDPNRPGAIPVRPPDVQPYPPMPPTGLIPPGPSGTLV